MKIKTSSDVYLNFTDENQSPMARSIFKQLYTIDEIDQKRKLIKFVIVSMELSKRKKE